MRTANVPPVPPPLPVTVPQSQPSVSSQRPCLVKIRKYGAKEFRGKKEDDPTEIEYWLENS